MRKRLLKIILLTSIVSIGISSCKKEPSFDRNTPPDEVAGARPPGKGKPRPPVANAGPNQTIILPLNTVALDGSASTDPNNNISSYLWTKVSGPSSFAISNANAVQTQVANLIEGVYQFELKVTDAGGLIGKDIVQVTVTSEGSPLPPPCTTCKIVFVSARDGNNEIYTCNTDGSNITRLTNDPDWDGQPVWSPDGTRIAFTSYRDGSSDIYIMNADGSNVVQRTFSVDPNGWIQGLTWSPDGTKIAYSESIFIDGESYTTSIYAVSATNGSPLLLLDHGWNPAWSPDGTKIALSEFSDIYTINSDGTGWTPLNVGFNSGDNSFDYPSWSPSGAKLALEYREIGYYNDVLYISVMNSDGSGLTLLRSGAGKTSWSADGTIIVYTSSSGGMNNVSWVAADGSTGGTIVTDGWDADWQH